MQVIYAGHALRSVERHDFHSGKVKHVCPINTPRSGVGVAVLDGKIYAVGGHDGSTYLNRSEWSHLQFCV